MERAKIIPQFVPYWGIPETKAVNVVIAGDYLNEHEKTREFEKKFAGFVGAKHCVAVTSGTIALYVAFNALALLYKDVRVPAHDGIFAHNALLAVDSSPKVTDVDEHGLIQVVNDGSEYVAVHANGRIVKKVWNIEDCSQAIDHHTPGKTSTYSFASTKHITTGGQGGAICTDDDDVFEMLTRVKDHGRNDRQHLRPMSDNYDLWGMNFKFTELQAGFGLAQLRSLPERLKRLKEIYQIYRDVLEKSVVFDTIEPKWYVDIFVDEPDMIIERLKKKNIFCRRYPKPLNLQRVAEGYLASGAFTHAEQRYNSGLYLPSTTNLSDEDVKFVAGEIKNALS